MSAETPAPSSSTRTAYKTVRHRWRRLDRGWKAAVLGTACTGLLLLLPAVT